MTQYLKQTGATLSATFDGDPGVVTVTVTKADGTAIATDAATSGTGTDARTYTLAPQDEPNHLTAVWTGEVDGVATKLTTEAEIVGGLIFTEAQARIFDDAKLASDSTYPSEAITEARDRITDNLETLTGVSWVPRFRRVELDGDGTDTLIVPNLEVSEVLSASIDGTALTADELADLKPYKDGRIRRKTLGTWTDGKDVVIEYVHGFDHPKDGVGYIAMRWLTHQIVGTNLPRTAIQQIDQLGTFRMATAGEKYPTGIPEVDAWLASHDHTLPGVA